MFNSTENILCLLFILSSPVQPFLIPVFPLAYLFSTSLLFPPFALYLLFSPYITSCHISSFPFDYLLPWLPLFASLLANLFLSFTSFPPSPSLSTPLLVKFFPNTWNPFLSYIPLSLRSLPFTPLYLTYLFFTSCYFSSFPLPPPCLLLPLFASLLTPSFLALLKILTSPDSAMHHFS